MTIECVPVDCAIIGGGPAGLTAGIYLRRFHRSIRLFDAGESRAARIPLTHNYPGFPEGIAGTELLERLREQFRRYEGLIEPTRVTALMQEGELLRLETTAGEALLARSVLLATGIVDNEPAIQGLAAARERGLIRHCPICDGYEYSGRTVGVFGADDHGVRELRFIRHFTDKLTFLSLCGDEQQLARLAPVAEELGAGLLAAQGCRIDCDDAGVRLIGSDGQQHHFDGLYCALGVHTRSELAVTLGAAHDGNGALHVTPHLETSIPGLYAAGDVVSGLDQLAVAIGQAAIAATAIHNGLARLRYASEDAGVAAGLGGPPGETAEQPVSSSGES